MSMSKISKHIKWEKNSANSVFIQINSVLLSFLMISIERNGKRVKQTIDE